MRLLAIDPGPTQSAFVVWDTVREEVLAKDIQENEELLLILPQYASDYLVTHLAIEMIVSYGDVVGESVFETCVWIGRFIQKMGLGFTKIYRGRVKLNLCDTKRAGDAQVRQALLDRYEPGLMPRQKPKAKLKGVTSHMWAALAVAVTWMDEEGR